MRDPFKIEVPSVVSFSGGRTSGYMLWRILQAHGGALPADVKVVFCNTGKERPETLDFVERCACEWNVPVVWLEYRCGAEGEHAFTAVDYATASRNGEPFEHVLRHHKQYRQERGNPAVLPNVVQRFCTSEMKIRTTGRYIETLGWDRGWGDAVGLRADEPRRVAKARASSNKWEVLLPLADAGVAETNVLAFWQSQPFDLQLQSYQGNCDLCFLKSVGKVERIMRERPDLADWWVRMESETGQRFRNDRPSYAALLERSKRASLPMMGDEEPDELSIACHCTD